MLDPEPGKGGTLLLGQLGIQRTYGFLQAQPAHRLLEVEAILSCIGLGILGQGIVEGCSGDGAVRVRGCAVRTRGRSAAGGEQEQQGAGND